MEAIVAIYGHDENEDEEEVDGQKGQRRHSAQD